MLNWGSYGCSESLQGRIYFTTKFAEHLCNEKMGRECMEKKESMTLLTLMWKKSWRFDDVLGGWGDWQVCGFRAEKDGGGIFWNSFCSKTVWTGQVCVMPRTFPLRSCLNSLKHILQSSNVNITERIFCVKKGGWVCICILQCHIFEKTKNLKFLADVNMNNLCQQQIVWQLWWEATMMSIFLLPHKMWSFGRSYARFTTTTIFRRHTNV